MVSGGILEIERDFSKCDGNFVIVASCWNNEIVEKLIEGAINTLSSKGIKKQQIRILRVPGAFEIPLMCKRVIESTAVSGVLALGVIIKGDTPHFEFVAQGCTTGLVKVTLETGVPIGFGVLTVDTFDQAFERAGPGSSNKGAEAALAAIDMVYSLEQLG